MPSPKGCPSVHPHLCLIWAATPSALALLRTQNTTWAPAQAFRNVIDELWRPRQSQIRRAGGVDWPLPPCSPPRSPPPLPCSPWVACPSMLLSARTTETDLHAPALLWPPGRCHWSPQSRAPAAPPVRLAPASADFSPPCCCSFKCSVAVGRLCQPREGLEAVQTRA